MIPQKHLKRGIWKNKWDLFWAKNSKPNNFQPRIKYFNSEIWACTQKSLMQILYAPFCSLTFLDFHLQ